MQASPVRHLIRPHQGEQVQLMALGVRFLIDGEMTGGRFSLVEHPLPPRRLGAPLHTHANEDEYSFVLQGRVSIQLGDEVLEGRSGDLILKPRGVPHTFWNAGDEEVRLLELISPAGFENYFRELAPLLASGDLANPLIAEVLARYGLDLDPSSVPVLAEKHNLRLG